LLGEQKSPDLARLLVCDNTRERGRYDQGSPFHDLVLASATIAALTAAAGESIAPVCGTAMLIAFGVALH
jgi:hypothetical protein